jgi:hypothetical protein
MSWNWSADNITALADSAIGAGGAIPFVGTPLSAIGALGHTAGAIYDGVTGDRDGAVAHGAQALWGAFGCIPGVPTAISAVGSGAGLLNRLHTVSQGGDASTSWGGLGDSVSELAVAGTNAIFGPDTTPGTGSGRTENAMSSIAGFGNWLFGPGTPEGTPTSGVIGPDNRYRLPGQELGNDIHNLPGTMTREIERLYGVPTGMPGM